MKIGLIDVTITMSYGGIQTAVWELAKQLHDAGHEVHLYGGNGDVRHELAGRQIHIHTYPYTPREKVIDLGVVFVVLLNVIVLLAMLNKMLFDKILIGLF